VNPVHLGPFYLYGPFAACFCQRNGHSLPTSTARTQREGDCQLTKRIAQPFGAMMGLKCEHPSLLPRTMNMSNNWNQAAGTGTGNGGEHDDGRIRGRREGQQGGSPSDPLLSAGRFYPVQDTNDPEADDDSPLANYPGGGGRQASPFSQQQPFGASAGLQASAQAYNPVHGTPTALNLPSQERKRPPPSHPGHPLLHPGQPKEADDLEEQHVPAAVGLDRKPPYIINGPDPFCSPHLSSVANSFEDEGTPATSSKRSRTMENPTEYYSHGGTPRNPPAAHLQHPAEGPYYSATWQQDGDFHHHHHYAQPYVQYPVHHVFNFGNDPHAHGLGMHPPPPLPPPVMPHSPSSPLSPLHSLQHQRGQMSMIPSSLQPRRSNRPSSRLAAASNREPVVNLARSVRAARAGEATIQAMHPTEEELAECQTPRARQALETWYQRLTELHMYQNEEGHCNVPQQYPKNRQLGVWSVTSRLPDVLTGLALKYQPLLCGCHCLFACILLLLIL
jgi:hypothetical protein